MSLDLLVLGMATLPAWGESLARAIHPQLNLSELDRQIDQQAQLRLVEGHRLVRNEALAVQLLKRVNTSTKVVLFSQSD